MQSNDSSHEPQRLRAIEYEPEYLASIQEIVKRFPRAEEAVEGIESFLSRRAEMGMAIQRYDPQAFATWLTKPLGDFRIRVLYHFDDDWVTMLGAWLVRDRPF